MLFPASRPPEATGVRCTIRQRVAQANGGGTPVYLSLPGHAVGGKQVRRRGPGRLQRRGIALWALPHARRSGAAAWSASKRLATARVPRVLGLASRRPALADLLANAFADEFNTYRPHEALDGLTPAEYFDSQRPPRHRNPKCPEPGQRVASASVFRYGAQRLGSLSAKPLERHFRPRQPRINRRHVAGRCGFTLPIAIAAAGLSRQWITTGLESAHRPTRT